MSLSQQRARVRDAERRMTAARMQVAAPASALLARGERHPLTAVGLIAGVGLLGGRFLPALPSFGMARMAGLASGLLTEAVGSGMLAQYLDPQ